MASKIIDTCLEDTISISEVLRCIHVSLLCVQHHPNDRLNMTSVVMMLSSEGDLPQPKEPAFLFEKNPCRRESSLNSPINYTTNKISFTELDAR